MTPDVVWAAALLATGVVSAVSTIAVLGRVRSYTQRVPITFAATTLAAAVWATARGFALLATTPAGALYWTQVSWIGAASVTTFWLVFVLSYTGFEDVLDRWTGLALTVEPVAVLTHVVTESRGPVPIAPDTAVSGADATIASAGSPVVLHAIYSVVLVLVGLGLLVRLHARSRRLYRRQVSVVLATSLVPVVTAVATGLGSGSAPRIDTVPVSFVLSSGIVLVGLFRYQLFDVTPVARDVVVGELRDGVVVADDSGRIVETNARAQELFEVAEGSLLGTRVSDLPRYGSTLQDLVDGETDREEFVLDTDGERCFFEATASQFGDEWNDERGRLLVFRDVTERRHTESEYRALIENSRDLISVLAPDGRRVYCSPSFERVLGYDPDDLVDRDAFDLVHPHDRSETRAAFEELVTGEPGTQNRIEYRARHANGSWRTFESVGVNLVDDPTVGGVVVNARDVTGRRRYEQRLRVLNRVLRHDLRNEMNVIQGRTDMILDERVTAEVKEHARIIRRKTDSLVELGEQTRKIDYTLHSTDGVEKPFEITAPIRERLDAIQREFPGAIIERDLPDEQWVIADDLIDSAVVNVIDNAIEHNDRVVPQITVGIDDVTHDGVGYVEVSVADNGPGIPAAERRVFTEGTETPLSHGSGLGLWLTEWIVSRSNGHLRFEENEPRGTVIRIRLRGTSVTRPSETTTGSPTAATD